MIETGDREALIRYRIDQAFNTIAEVDKLISFFYTIIYIVSNFRRWHEIRQRCRVP